MTPGSEHDQRPRQLGLWVRHELVLPALQHGFTERLLSPIVASVRPQNAPSARVLAKCGFSRLRYDSLLTRDHHEVRRATWPPGATAHMERAT